MTLNCQDPSERQFPASSAFKTSIEFLVHKDTVRIEGRDEFESLL